MERMTVMDFEALAATRFSVRDFKKEAPSQQLLKTVLEAGRVAPTAANRQPVVVYVLESADALKCIRQITPCVFNAPAVMLVCGKPEESWINPFNSRNSAQMDAAIVATHMMLQAADLGLGTTWVCWFNAERVKKEFALPQGTEPYCLLPIGYPNYGVVPTENHHCRKKPEEMFKKI